MADTLPAVPALAHAMAMASSPLRGGKRHIDESAVAYSASLELPIATGKRTFRSNEYSLTAGTVGAAGQSPRGPAGATSYNTTSAIFGSAIDGDSSPAMSRKYNVALHADMKLKNVQARMEAAKALRSSKGGDAPEEDLDDEGNPKSPKKKGGMPAGDYSPRKRIEDFLFLKQGKQWCPPTRYNGAIPEPPQAKKKEEEAAPPLDSDAKKQKQEEFIERLNKPLKRENKKKAKAGVLYTVTDRQGKLLEGEEAEAYRKQIVPKMMERLEGDKEKRKKEHEIAIKKRLKEESSLQKESKKLTDEEALAHNINKLFTEPLNKKRTNAIAKEKKEAAARAKSPRLSVKEHADSGRRMHEEGIEKQRQAVAKATARYFLRPASASPTAAYNHSHDIESKYCPGLDLSEVMRPATALHSGSDVPKVPRPPATARI